MDYNGLKEESVINYVRHLSLDKERSNPSSKFDSIAITVRTITNNGQISNREIDVSNACFFISVAQATKLDPFRLLLCSQYEHWNEILDSDRKEDLECIRRVSSLVGHKINIYSGQKIENGLWKVNPTPLSIIDVPDSEGKQICVVTNNSHFECILPEECQKFIKEPIDINSELAIKLQRQAEMYLYLSGNAQLIVNPRRIMGLEVILSGKKELLERSTKRQIIQRENYKIVFDDAAIIICRTRNDD